MHFYRNFRYQLQEGLRIVLNVKEFPDDFHIEAKIQAAILGISLEELIIKAFKDYQKNRKNDENLR